ncbi:MAG TPA: ABC transporter permease [Bryobacteraceae bacterium]|nr:ABC transporter permease [Bryobacteraceae bacterium]
MDVKFALRSLAKNPSFTVLAVCVMALGIGANTAVFSVVNSVLLKPLAFRDPDRIVTIANLWKKTGSIGTLVSAPDYHDWHDQNTAFDAMAYYQGGQTSVVTGPVAEYGDVALVTPEFFRVLAIQPIAGRLFNTDEQKIGGPGAVLISQSYWQSHFGGNTRALGQTVHIYGKPLTIVGVLPADFHFPGKTDLWSTSGEETTSRSSHNYLPIARLKPDVTLEQAQTQLTAIASRLEQQFPNSNKNKGVVVTRMRDQMVSSIRLTLYLLLGAVGMVLLIACANMANLLLAKATSRTREIAIRAAVGASRGRIVRQLITESLMLALASGVVGLILAVWGADALIALAPKNVPRLAETEMDLWVLAFTFGVSLVSSLIFGLAPALQASRVDLNNALKQGGTRSVLGGGAGRIRSALVVAEIALSVVLLTGAGLLIRSFQALGNVDLGFKPEKILVASTSVPTSNLKDAQRATQFYKGLLTDVASLPGVSAAGATAAPPGSIRSNGGYWIDHLPPREKLGLTSDQAVFTVVAPGTFQTLGIPLRIGRDFNAGDVYEAPFTAVINEELARKSFPGQDPIGRTILCGMDSPNPMTIVGVVGNVRQWGPATAPWPEIYMPFEQHPYFAVALHLLIRTPAEPTSLSEALRRKIRERSPEVPVKFTTMEASLANNVAAPRFRTLLLGIFAGLAVCLAMAGVYGVMAYVVSQRSSEIGLRMAMGAGSGDVLRLVLGQGLTLAGIGLLVGLAGSVAATRLLNSVLFEVKPTDPLTYVAVATVLAVVALAASYIPARRATRVDPLVALRQE